MSLTFGKTTTDIFSHILMANPRLLTRNTYLNYLRYYKMKHPRWGMERLLQNGAKAWGRLSSWEQDMFKQKNILGCIPRPHVRSGANVGPIKRFGPSYSTRVPTLHMPMHYKRRSMNAAKNVRNRQRNISRFSRFGRRS